MGVITTLISTVRKLVGISGVGDGPGLTIYPTERKPSLQSPLFLACFMNFSASQHIWFEGEDDELKILERNGSLHE